MSVGLVEKEFFWWRWNIRYIFKDEVWNMHVDIKRQQNHAELMIEMFQS